MAKLTKPHVTFAADVDETIEVLTGERSIGPRNTAIRAQTRALGP